MFSALAHERSSIAEVYGLIRQLERLKELARSCKRNGRPAAEDPAIRRRIAEATTAYDTVEHAEGTFAVGGRVFHQKFGYGRVVAVDGNKLEIAFDKAGTKKVIDSFVRPV